MTRCSAIAILTALMAAASPAYAQESSGSAGFQVVDAYTELKDGVYQLNAEISVALPEAVIEAIESGVPIVLELMIEIREVRRYLWDEELAELTQRVGLRYHALSGQYVVTDFATGVQHSYSSRRLALRMIGLVRDLPLLDRSLLGLGLTYAARMRATLLVEELPAPLRLWAYIAPSWNLHSEWFEWLLQSSNG